MSGGLGSRTTTPTEWTGGFGPNRPDDVFVAKDPWRLYAYEVEAELRRTQHRCVAAEEALRPFTFPELMFGQGQLCFDKVEVKVEVGDVRLAREVLAAVPEKDKPVGGNTP